MLFMRYFKGYWRSPPYNTTRLILAVVSGLVLGSAYWSLGDEHNTVADVINILGALFFSIISIGFVNFQVLDSFMSLY